MSIKRLALCRSQELSVCAASFAGQDVAALIEREVLKRLSMRRRAVLVCRRWCSRSIMACAGALPFRFRLQSASLQNHVLPFLDASSMDVVFASGGQRLGSIRLDSRVAKLESKINYKAKACAVRAYPRCAAVANAAVATRSMPFAICRQTPARCGAMRVTWAGDPQCAPEFQISDTHMNAIDVTVHVFESQVDAAAAGRMPRQ
ncbi:MAG: hypothetical protein ACLU1W_02730 [Collinsella sp.]